MPVVSFNLYSHPVRPTFSVTLVTTIGVSQSSYSLLFINTESPTWNLLGGFGFVSAHERLMCHLRLLTISASPGRLVTEARSSGTSECAVCCEISLVLAKGFEYHLTSFSAIWVCASYYLRCSNCLEGAWNMGADWLLARLSAIGI